MILAQLIWYKNFLTLLKFLYKQEFRKFYPAQNALNYENTLYRFEFD